MTTQHGRPFAGVELPDEPRRLTPTERLHEVTMQALTRTPLPSEHTVDISRNAKGQVQWAVAVRGSDIDEVVRIATEKADELATRYPFEQADQGNGAS